MNIWQEYQDNKILFSGSLILLLATFMWAFSPTLSDLVQTWYNNEDYSHGFFIIPLTLYLIWRKKHLWPATEPKLSWLGLLLVVFSLFAFLVGTLSEFRSLANISIILAIWGSILFLLGYRFFTIYSWDLFFLIFMIPIPSGIYSSLTLPLQLIVTKVSSFLLQSMGIPVFREGNLLHLSNMTLEVVNACSGLRSILTILVFSFFISCLQLRLYYQRILLILFSVPLAMLVNFIRVVIVALFSQHGYQTFTYGLGHILLGLALFLFSFFLLLLVSRGLEWVFTKK